MAAAPPPFAPAPGQTPDAIRCPLHLPKPRRGEDQLLAIKRLFAPVFKCERVYSRQVVGRGRLITPVTANPHDADHPHNYDQTHPKAGQERHLWVPQGETGIEYGYLLPDEDEGGTDA